MMISCCWTPPPWRRCSWWSGLKVTQPEMMHVILNLQLCKTTHLSRKKANSRLTIVFWLPTSATLQVNTINCKHSFLSLKTLPKNDPRKIICMWTSFSVLALEMHKYKGFQFSQMMHFVWVLIQLEISRFWNLPQERKKTCNANCNSNCRARRLWTFDMCGMKETQMTKWLELEF